MKKICLILVCLFLSAIHSSASAQTAGKDEAAAKATINAYIAKQAKEAEADEYPDARKIVLGDLDNDGDVDAAVLFTLEGFGGGNFWARSLAAFLNNKGTYKFLGEETVGSKNGERTVELKNIKEGKIWLDAEYCDEPPQGLCESPKKAEVYFKLEKNKLVETSMTAAS